MFKIFKTAEGFDLFQELCQEAAETTNAKSQVIQQELADETTNTKPKLKGIHGSVYGGSRMFLTLQILAGHDGQAKTSGAISAIPLNLKVTASSLPL